VPKQIQSSGGWQAVNLKEDRVFLELHLTGGDVNIGNVWYLDNRIVIT